MGQHQDLQFSKHDTWDRILEQGITLLIRFCLASRPFAKQDLSWIFAAKVSARCHFERAANLAKVTASSLARVAYRLAGRRIHDAGSAKSAELPTAV